MQWFDSLRALTNSLSGLGGARDKASYGSWGLNVLDRNQLECAYRSNWMAEKAVDIPAFDMLREGWTWEADDNEVEAIEAEEKRLGVAQKVQHALRLARLYGGSGLILGDGAGDTSKPLNPERIRKGGLKYVVVASRHQLASQRLDADPESPWFGEPEMYQWLTSDGHLDLHPSRVIRFIGKPIPSAVFKTSDDWGDSILLAVEEAIRDAQAAQNGIAALVQEAAFDVVKIPRLTELVSTAAGQQRLLDRFSTAAAAKSIVNTLILDAEEDWSQKTANFSQLPEVQRLFLQVVAGAADIPATRFLGQSPAGMTATGESDIRNYYDRISSEQETNLRPCLERLFAALIPSALGRPADDVTFAFNPLWQMTEKEQAEIGKLEAETTGLLIGTGLVPDAVMAEGVKGLLIEGGRYPGIKQAYEDFGEFEPDEAEPPVMETPAEPEEEQTDPVEQ